MSFSGNTLSKKTTYTVFLGKELQLTVGTVETEQGEQVTDQQYIATGTSDNERDTDETTPLLGEAPPNGNIQHGSHSNNAIPQPANFIHQILHAILEGLVEAKNSAQKGLVGAKNYIKENPAYVVTSAVTVPQPAINSLLALSNSKTRDLSTFWNKPGMTDPIRGWSVVAAASSGWVNFILGLIYLPATKKKLVTTIKTFPQHPIRNSISLLLGLFGAFTAAALTMSAFFTTPVYVILFFAITSLIISFATRFMGASRFFDEKIASRWDKNKILQNKITAQLTLVKERHHQQIQGSLNEITAQLALAPNPSKEDTDAYYSNLIQSYVTQLVELRNQYPEIELFDEEAACCSCEKLNYAANKAIDIILTLIATITAYLMYTQKTVDGAVDFETIVSTNTTHVADLDPTSKILSGSLGGISFALLAGGAASQLRPLLIRAAKQLLEEPSRIPSGILLAAACALSSFNMWNIATNIAADPTNIFDFLIHDYNLVYYLGAVLIGFSINTEAVIKFVYPEKVELNNPRPTDVVDYWKDANKNSLPKQTLTSLQALSVFLTPVQSNNPPPAENRAVKRHCTIL